MLPQYTQEAEFHIDHIHPRAHGGQTTEGNLALACVSCSLKKGARLHLLDPETQRLVPIFHPRKHRWADHFHWTRKWRLVGRTAVGRATISALKLNRADLVRIRCVWAGVDKFPKKI